MGAAGFGPGHGAVRLNWRQRLGIAALLALLVHLCALPFLPRKETSQRISMRVMPLRMIMLKPMPKPQPKRHLIHRRRVIVRVRRHVIHLARSHEGARMRSIVRPHVVHRIAKAPPRAVIRHELVRKTATPEPQASVIPSDVPIADSGINGAAHDGPAVTGGGAEGTRDNGNGTGTQGTGTGNGAIPCGALDLVSLRTTVVLGAAAPGMPADAIVRVEHRIRATTHYADGHTETAEFPYPFTYGPTESDPFSRANRDNPNVLILVQFPPAGVRRKTLPPVIQSILGRTSVEGISLFLPCGEHP